eukprot:g6129.t1
MESNNQSSSLPKRRSQRQRTKLTNEQANRKGQNNIQFLIPELPNLFLGLHMLYEDCKLSLCRMPLLHPLSSLLFAIAKRWAEAQDASSKKDIQMFKRYMDHYCRDHGTIMQLPKGTMFPSAMGSETSIAAAKIAELVTCSSLFDKGSSVDASVEVHTPPNVMLWLQRCLEYHNDKLASLLPTLPFKGLKNSKRGENENVMSIDEDDNSHLLGKNQNAAKNPCRLTKIVCEYVCELYCDEKGAGPSRSKCEKILARMVEDGFTREVLQNLPFGVALPLQQALYDCRSDLPMRFPAEAYLLAGREDLAALHPRKKRDAKGKNEDEYVCWKPPPHLLASSCIPGDLDGLEVVQNRSRLRFCKDKRMREVCRLLRSSRPMRLRFERPAEVSDADFVEEQQKALRYICIRAMAVSVGRGMLTFGTTSPLLTETLPIPPLVLAARVPEENNAIRELVTSLLPADFTHWPEFHNGAAAGLRLEASGVGLKGWGIGMNSWILYNKPPQPTFAHAGFLLALGLQGYLNVLRISDIFCYLRDKHDATTVGLLLGLSACKRGSADVSVYKMLCLHLPAVLPSMFGTISTTMQTSALLSLGLLYQSTSNRFTADFLLGEIGRGATDRDAGDNASRGSRGSSGGEGYSLAAGLGFGLVTLGCGRFDHDGSKGLEDLCIEDRLQRYMTGGRDRSSWVNTAITASGATLALGMMFLKSNDESVAQRLAVPDTLFLLDYVRPDLLLLRVLCRSLVLWDSISGTLEWVDSQIPKMLRDAYGKLDEGTTDLFSNQLRNGDDGEVDLNSVRQAYCNVVAGACSAIGYRFAGTADVQAYETLLHHLRAFHSFRRRGHRKRPDPATLEMCISSVAIALGMVMAGTGDLVTLRLLRELRWKTGPKVTYGRHMALHSAIGLLFLGGGACTLSRSDNAIGALLCAFFPRYPLISSDQQYHLQAARHLYVLAVERRLLQAIDADTQEELIAPVRVFLKNEKNGKEIKKDMTIPCMLPDTNLIDRIIIGIDGNNDKKDSRYWPLQLDIKANAAHRAILSSTSNVAKNDSRSGHGAVLLLKRKAGHLSYASDPRGLRSLMARSYSAGTRRRKVLSEFVRAYAHDPKISAFAEHFCRIGNEMNEENLCPEGALVDADEFCCSILYECLVEDKPQMLQTYIAIRQSLSNLQKISNFTKYSELLQQIWNFKLVLAHCSRYDGVEVIGTKCLIDPAFARRSEETLQRWSGNMKNDDLLITYFKSLQFPKEKERAAKLASRLAWFNIPLLEGIEVFTKISQLGELALPELVFEVGVESFPAICQMENIVDT